MNILLHYIKYRLKAKGRHGIHSPFVYSFVNECLTTKVDKKFLTTRKNIFKKLKNNQKTIEIEDFGAGSKRLEKHRRIKDLFRISSSKGKYGSLLYKISKFYQPKNTLEFGTSLGIGSIHLSEGNVSGQVITVEACKNTFSAAKINFESLNSKNILQIQATFDDFLQSYSGEKFDLIFIDGHHNGTALIRYMEALKPFSHNDTLFIVDDIRWSPSMFEAWTALTQDPYYHVAMDLFRMGIITPRHQQVKESFVIKI